MRRFASAVVLVVVGALAPVAVAGSAEAIPLCLQGYQCVRTYYTSAAHTQVVGENVRWCDGHTSSWGTTTSYVVTTQARCSDPAAG